MNAIPPVLLAVGLALAGPAVAQHASSDSVTFAIERKRLPDALAQWSEVTGLQVVSQSAILRDLSASPVVGKYTPMEALRLMLVDTPLTITTVNKNTVSIEAIQPNVTTQNKPTASMQRLAAAQAAPAAPARAASDAGSSRTSADSGNTVQEEVIVTAQKRAERVIDVPQSVSVVPSEDLAKLGATQFRDFATTVPGLTFSTAGAGYTQISLRGVTAGVDIGQTVGIYVDEVPYGSSSAFGAASQHTLDVGLFDVGHIEVLRGPQGTLYGASTMGGLIKYVSKRPDLLDPSFEATMGGASTKDGGASYNGSAAFNIPLVENRAALRASSFYSHDGGYIDNLARNDKDANTSDVYGGRLDLLLAPTDELNIRLSGFAQNIARDGESTGDYALSGAPLDDEFDQRRLFSEPFNQRFRVVSGTVTYDFGGATLTSVSSYQTTSLDYVQDLSVAYIDLVNLFGTYTAVAAKADGSTDKFTQEIRLASDEGETIEWLVGAFYTKEDSDYAQEFLLRSPDGSLAPNSLYDYSIPTKFEEVAAFGDVTWRFAESFDMTAGVRVARNEQDFTQISNGIFTPSAPKTSASEDVFTYLVNARYHFDQHKTAYVRYATGYRPGGPNVVTNDPVTGLPVGSPTFDADRLKSYEIGFKAETADRTYAIDVAAYLIDWDDIHVSVVRNGFSAIDNARGGARIYGGELAFTAVPVEGLALSTSLAYQNARMLEDEPALGAAEDERLPNVPRFTAALSADYEFASASNLRPTIGASIRHVDERMASFDGSTGYLQYRLPEYTTVDLRTGVSFGAVDMQLYARNIFNERGELSAYNWRGTAMPALMQPLTIGINATTRF
jgi:iron complex outermembrane receptor protein